MDEASDEDQHDLSREAAARADRFWALGYREGLDQGKESVLEANFQRGYAKGMQTGRSLGRAQGILTGLQSLQGRLQGGAATAAQQLANAEDVLSPASTEQVCQAMLAELSTCAEASEGADQIQTQEQAQATMRHLQARAQAVQDVLQQS